MPREYPAEDWAVPAPPAAGKAKTLVFALLGLAFFLTWQAFEQRSYIRRETRPPAWDQAIHMEIALDYRRAFQGGRPLDALTLAPKPGMPPFPPLYHLALMRAYDSPDPAAAALWLNWVYLAILSVALFGITWEFKPDMTAVLPAVIFCCSPVVHRLYHTQLLDLSVAAWAAAGYWALVRSNGFRRWGSSLVFGLVFAVGMLHKWSYFSYFLPAYWAAYQALRRPESRLQVIAAALLALAGTLPWYLIHFPILLPRLFEASADFAVPVYKGFAFFKYIGLMTDDLGPLFWALGWVGIILPQYRRDWESSWLLLWWVVASYVFWAIVPNRQMRFLLPGLPALAVAAVFSFPKNWSWTLAAWQWLASINYCAGWIPSLNIPLPMADVNFLVVDPPRTEDWKVREILETAQKQRDPAAPISNLTLVANDVYFNGPNFTWLAKLLGDPRISLRGVNSRLCEFSEFLVLKTGTLGPPQVIKNLPEAAKIVTASSSWFDRAYDEVQTWPLPDGSSAVLFRQRPIRVPPFGKEPNVFYQYYAYESGHLEGSNFRFQFGPWDADRSVYKSLAITATEARLRELQLTDLSIELSDVLAVPAEERAGGKIGEDVRFLKLGKLRINSLKIGAEDLRALIERRVKGLKISRLSLDKTVKFAASLRNFNFSGEATVEFLQSPRRLKIELAEAKLGFSPMPLWLFNRIRTYELPLEPTPELPFALELAGLTLSEDRLSVP